MAQKIITLEQLIKKLEDLKNEHGCNLPINVYCKGKNYTIENVLYDTLVEDIYIETK